MVVWPLLFGLGAYLALTAQSQPWGRPKPDLAERLRRLDVDERLRTGLGDQGAPSVFASRVLERLLRPVLDDAGRLVQAGLGRIGLAGGDDLERKLRQVGPTRHGSERKQIDAAAGELVQEAIRGAQVVPNVRIVVLDAADRVGHRGSP